MNKYQEKENIGMMRIPMQEMKIFRKGMFDDYIRGLENIAGKKVDIPFESYFENGGREKDRLNIPYYFIDKNNNSNIGFALIALVDKNIPANPYNVDMFLWQFYIDSGQRRQGLGTECARLLLSRHPGLIQLNFYDENTRAEKLWNKVVREYAIPQNGHKRFILKDSGTTYYQFTVQRGINGIANDKCTSAVEIDDKLR